MERTSRGFAHHSFKDSKGFECSLQESSAAFQNAIWFGIDEAKPKILASKVTKGIAGWVDYPIHPDVLIPTRMHLTQEQVQELLPMLQHFAETGELPDDL